MDTPRDKYYTKLLETVIDYNDHHNELWYNEKLRQEIITVMAKREEDKRNKILDANNVTMDTFCQSPVITNTQGENANTIFIS